jgi:hypothetical protein
MSDSTSRWGAAFGQLTRTTAAPVRQHFNPYPPGVLQEGGAAKAVLAFLEANQGRYFTLGQLILATGRTDKSLDWACRFLCSIGRVEWRSDESRNPKYRRYAFKPQPTNEGDQP